MQQQPKIAIKLLVLFLAFFSIGGGSGYAFNFSEVREEQSSSSEKLAAANPLSVAYRENLFQELPEVQQNPWPVISSLGFTSFSLCENPSGASYFSFNRDLRKDLKIQLFPKHFFL